MSKTVSIISALLCTIIWGTTFIAQETGMEKIGPYTFNAVRFFVGFLALIPFYLILEKSSTIKIISNDKMERAIYSGVFNDEIAQRFFRCIIQLSNVGLKELYLNLSLSKSKINMVRDVISSGDEITGTTFIKDFYTSSYSNGQLIRQ